MTYETDPAGLGVGKRYGEREMGGVVGTVGGVDAERQFIFELNAGSGDASNAGVHTIPANARITKAEIRVDEAYAATSSATVSLDNGTAGNVTTSAFDLATAGYADKALSATVADLLVGSDPGELSITLDAAALASATGDAVIVITAITA